MTERDIGGQGALARAERTLSRLHPAAIADAAAIKALFQRLCRERVTLYRGMNHRIKRELAWVAEVNDDECILRTRDFEPDRKDFVFLNFHLDGQAYFLSSPFDREVSPERLAIRLPPAVYRAERRSRQRIPRPAPTRVALETDDHAAFEGVLSDLSPEGMAVDIAERDARNLRQAVRLRFLDDSERARVLHGEVRNRRPTPERNGWIRVGLDISAAPPGASFQVEQRLRVMPTTALQRTQRSWHVLSAAARFATNRIVGRFGRPRPLPQVRVVDYENRDGERIRAIVNTWGAPRDATAVVIPPAWGRTKETLMPLAVTIVENFKAAEQPVVVVRFDGIRKRGESHRDRECREFGKEHHRFTFSQGVRDICATLDFLEHSPEFQCRRNILVSFSAASIESRRAVVIDQRIHGWVCVVGAADTQWMMRVISGGVDYVAGVERGLRFGRQEVLGVDVDIDHAGEDLLRHKLAFLDDARRDFAMIRVPVTWIHGQHDAWMNADRARDALSRGDASNRRFITIPTGHVLRTSTEALETFQLVSGEIARMALGRELPPSLPNLVDLSLQRQAEQNRLENRSSTDLRTFWRDYLVGRDSSVGIELMTHTAAYRSLMQAQIEALRLRPGSTVADLGCGTGAFALQLGQGEIEQPGGRILALDFVREALKRSSERLREVENAPSAVWHIAADLDVPTGALSFPLASNSVDGVLAGLFLSYVLEPHHVLEEIRRVLKPGGRLVVSALRRDADFSKLFLAGLAELRSGDGEALVANSGGQSLDDAARAYLNEAARLLDFEESGRFRFWERGELESLVRAAGFVKVQSVASLGSPPQAIVVSGVRS